MRTVWSRRAMDKALTTSVATLPPLPRKRGRPPKVKPIDDFRVVIQRNAEWQELKDRIAAAERNFRSKKAAMQVAGIELQELKHKLNKLEEQLDA